MLAVPGKSMQQRDLLKLSGWTAARLDVDRNSTVCNFYTAGPDCWSFRHGPFGDRVVVRYSWCTLGPSGTVRPDRATPRRRHDAPARRDRV
jgi:hypothetical protein